MSRDELFNSRFAPLLPATAEYVLLDRFLGSQFTQDGYRDSGAYWFCKKIFSNDLPRIKILSGKRVSNENINFGLLEKRIYELKKELNCNSKIELYLGFTPHDRQSSFYFGKGRGSQSLTMGAGVDIFRHESLRDGFAVVNLDLETAVANEKMVMNSQAVVRISL